MSNCLYDKGRQAFAEGGIAWLTDTIKAVLVDLDAYALLITGATNATPIVITTSGAHGLSTGDKVAIKSVLGNTAANGNWTITVLSSTTFSLDTSSGSGAWTSGGYVVPVSRHQYLSDIPGGARIATSPAFSGKTTTNGVLDATDATFTAVTGTTIEAAVIYKDTGVAGTSPLIAYFDTLTGLVLTPNSGDVTWTFSNAAEKIFKL